MKKKEEKKEEKKSLTLSDLLKSGNIKQRTFDAVQKIESKDKKKRVLETMNRRVANNEHATDGL